MVPAVGVVHLCPWCTGKGDLPRKSTGPNDDNGDRDERQADEAPCPPPIGETVEDEEADDQSAEYGSNTFERGI